LNPSDPNAHVNFGFCEFTLNNDQLFANISYVDFVPRIPIALRLENKDGRVEEVLGMPPDGLDRICDGLSQQTQKDGRPWDKLVVQHEGKNLRALNATHGGAVGATFDGYYGKYNQWLDAYEPFPACSLPQILIIRCLILMFAEQKACALHEHLRPVHEMLTLMIYRSSCGRSMEKIYETLLQSEYTSGPWSARG
jgi:hypothetical protein